MYMYIFTFSYLADAFIHLQMDTFSELQMRKMEAIKINKIAMICKSQLA